MDLRLQPADHAFREEVRAFIRDHLTPEMRAAQSRIVGPYPEPGLARPWQQALARRGWAAPAWPPEHGGPGWTALQRFIFESECALAGAPIVYPIGIRLAAPVIMKYGTADQQRRWLPPILTDEDHWCQGFSEPGAGSDLASLTTRAVRDGDEYVIDGTKLWTTHAHHANWMFALVRTAQTARRQDGISFIAIPMNAPGIEIRPILSIGGDHDVNQVFLDGVRVPVDHLIGEEGKGWAYAKYLLEFERGNGLFSGRLRASLKRAEDAVDPDRLDDAARLRIAEVAFEIDAFEMLELMTLGTLENGATPGPVASVLKLRASRLKQRVARLGIDLLGPEALRRDGDGPRSILVTDYLNSRAATIFGGTSEIQLGIIAQSLAGI